MTLKKKSLVFIMALAGMLVWAGCSDDKKHFVGGEIYSADSVKFGRFEVRMRCAEGGGVVSSFFLILNNCWNGPPLPWRELDFEAMGKHDGLLQTNYRYVKGRKTMWAQMHKLEASLSKEFHKYTIDWTPDYIAWYVDDRLIRKIDSSEDSVVIKYREHYMSYRFNTWVTKSWFWGGYLSKRHLPSYQYIDWIKYYKYKPADSTQKNGFVLEWTDDFDFFDSTRWRKGDWIDSGNCTTIKPENISVSGGMLKICLQERMEKGT